MRLSAFLAVLALAAILASAVSSTSCDNAGPRRTGPGPVYKIAGVPTKRDVCGPSRSTTLGKVKPESCYWGACWSLERVAVPTTRIIIRGRIMSTSTCGPVSGAIIDVWQTDNNGRYGSPKHLEEPGHCRARIQSDSEGKYEFETEVPGPYGIFSVMSPDFNWWPNLPPYLPSHIHVLSWAPHHNVFSTQLYLPDDAARSYDPRYNLLGAELAADEPRNVLNLTLKGGVYVSNVDFYLTANASSPHKELLAAVEDAFCQNPSEPAEYVLPLCAPNKVWVLQHALIILLAILLVALFIIAKILGFIFGVCCGSKKAQPINKKPKRE